ncbi:E3 ubiquitin-protein ligase FANCL isoform X1 [Frieseomelitta varia]|uniref:E3 ubiquitin-protein ligase FANCL isoform X1 n=1 Tax=Frieseomelitta varia TaxID=561572 RepID=UPI001CB6A6E5|nr:E3 ubiquitin-protein ligase FANCL isoform X1 [Frieseomelitta varia]
MMSDYKFMIQLYPEMILVSKKPVTWKGFLEIPCNSGRSMRIRLKLIVHNYPSLSGAEIYFGKEIAFIRRKEFSDKVKDLMCSVTKVSTFLKQLQLLISNFINSSYIENYEYDVIADQAMETLMELKNVLKIPSGIKISSDSSLNTIELSLNNVTVRLQRTSHRTCPWTVVYSDLPEISTLGPFERNISTLDIARNKLKLQVEMLKKVWSNLKQIDENCWVIDPLQPKPCHLYRRIYLTPSLSMFIKIDPLNHMDLPEIKFMGSDIEVESKTDLVSRNLNKWDPSCDIINNLMTLLDIDAFPKKEIKKEEIDYNVIVTDEECCICFSLKLDNETLPDKICNNEKCRRHFHTSCLLQWLQTIAGNHVIFHQIHGSCPNCKESISCRIN